MELSPRYPTIFDPVTDIIVGQVYDFLSNVNNNNIYRVMRFSVATIYLLFIIPLTKRDQYNKTTAWFLQQTFC